MTCNYRAACGRVFCLVLMYVPPALLVAFFHDNFLVVVLDGVPLFCSREGCSDAHQPFLSLGLLASEAAAQYATPVASCAGCNARLCIKCGKDAHEGHRCRRNDNANNTTALDSYTDVNDRLCVAYSVGCVGACPRCGANIARESGCPFVRCAICEHRFKFEAFRTQEEVNGTGPLSTSIPWRISEDTLPEECSWCTGCFRRNVGYVNGACLTCGVILWIPPALLLVYLKHISGVEVGACVYIVFSIGIVWAMLIGDASELIQVREDPMHPR